MISRNNILVSLLLPDIQPSGDHAALTDLVHSILTLRALFTLDVFYNGCYRLIHKGKRGGIKIYHVPANMLGTEIY